MRDMSGPDLVAVILATGLTLGIVLILVVTIVKIVLNEVPQVALSENGTQVLVTAFGGQVGILGAYIGVNRQRR